jgi:hypothetical protein
MANIIKEFLIRIKIDWQEWRGFQISVWNVKRDKKAIERAIHRAKIKNSSDGRTYYILRNLAGGFDEVSSAELRNLKAKKIKYFPRYRDYEHMLTLTFAIVTSNNIQRKSYVEAVRNIQNDELNSLKNDTERQKDH